MARPNPILIGGRRRRWRGYTLAYEGVGGGVGQAAHIFAPPHPYIALPPIPRVAHGSKLKVKANKPVCPPPPVWIEACAGMKSSVVLNVVWC